MGLFAGGQKTKSPIDLHTIGMFWKIVSCFLSFSQKSEFELGTEVSEMAQKIVNIEVIRNFSLSELRSSLS